MKQIDKDTISLEWCTDDVLSQCDWLTKEQAREVFKQDIEQGRIKGYLPEENKYSEDISKFTDFSVLSSRRIQF